MSTNQYTHRNPSYEQQFIKNETQPYKHLVREINPQPNPIYKNPLQYYDSPVQNSMIYPNIGLIKPVNYDYIPVDTSVFLDKTIQENQRFAYGPYIIENNKNYAVRWA